MAKQQPMPCPKCGTRDCAGHPTRQGVTVYWAPALGRFVSIPDRDDEQ
jgi:hypothetical protein